MKRNPDTLIGARVRILPGYSAPVRVGQIGTVQGRAAIRRNLWRLLMQDGSALCVADQHIERVRARRAEPKESPFDPENPQHRTRRRAAERVELAKAQPVQITAGTSRVLCDGGFEVMRSLRPGAEDHRQWPSRMNSRLHYPDGRVTDLQGAPIPTP